MKHNAYVIFDSAAQIYNKPFYFVNDNVALRAAYDLRADTSTEVSTHPEDFSLWFIGSFDDTTATFELATHKKRLVSFHELPEQIQTQQQEINPEHSS